MDIDGNQCEFRFTLKPAAYQPSVFFKVKLSDHTLWMGLSEFPPVEFFSKKYKNIEFEKLTPDVQPIILDSILDGLLQTVEEGLGVSMKLLEFQVDSQPESLGEELYFSLTVKGTNKTYWGHISVGFPTFQYLASILGPVAMVPSMNFEQIPVATRVAVGDMILSARQFSNIQVRDILLFPGKPYYQDGKCKVSFGNKFFYLASYKGGIVTLTNTMEEENKQESMEHEDSEYTPEDEDTEEEEDYEDEDEDLYEEEDEEDEDHDDSDDVLMEEEDEEEQEPVPSAPKPKAVVPAVAIPSEKEQMGDDLDAAGLKAPLGDLPVHVIFEVGEKQIPLKELRTVQAGFTFELSNPVERPVTIRANGRVVGTGELIQVGERVGVRVISFKQS